MTVWSTMFLAQFDYRPVYLKSGPRTQQPLGEAAFVVLATAVSAGTLGAIGLRLHWSVDNQVLHDALSIPVLFTKSGPTIDALFH